MKDRISKLQKLLRHHRQNVFGPAGDAHERAIVRLKKSTTFKEMCKLNKDAAKARLSQSYERMGY